MVKVDQIQICNKADKCGNKECNHSKPHTRNDICDSSYCGFANDFAKCISVRSKKGAKILNNITVDKPAKKRGRPKKVAQVQPPPEEQALLLIPSADEFSKSLSSVVEKARIARVRCLVESLYSQVVINNRATEKTEEQARELNVLLQGLTLPIEFD